VSVVFVAVCAFATVADTNNAMVMIAFFKVSFMICSFSIAGCRHANSFDKPACQPTRWLHSWFRSDGDAKELAVL